MNPQFTQLTLRAELQSALSKAGFSRMTPIQLQSLPELLAGKDVVAQAKTGSGKTLAFSLAMLQSLVVPASHIQGLILVPTRELANQVAEEVRKLAKDLGNVKVLTICGGEPIGPQISSLEHGAHVVVGTPGRVEEHLFKGTLDLTQVSHFTLDEADQMLEMGFVDAIENIAVYLPPARQTMMFSATYPKDIEQLSARFMQSPILVKGETETLNKQIKQQFFPLKNNKLRFNTLRLLLLQHKPQSCIVFCNTKVETKKLFSELQQTGLQVAVLHGDLAQIERQRMLLRFANKSASVLVATDVAARGLDIDDIDMVVNYHMALDPQTHVHRVGRTGRGGKKGFACSLYGENETFKVKQLCELYEREFNPSPTPPLSLLDKPAYKPTMVTIVIDAGKKQKVRAGDIVGCLTGENGIGSAHIGNITVQDNQAYIAIFREAVKPAIRKLNADKIKGKRIKAKRLV
ncbi:ATP-dependent RNA helicase DbpA [Pseudoalteromonas luteoviolacea]|uniref:ATP-dependent RNA helicase DbpA n=1 Tax=Pseudoalteromonas luteoviolacea TaxID=43657 RepID=UPI00114EC514|nr:ATP-dependent RNA helicase DbpA [Pseudoalteromonas luteoviolacea]TQF72709.1 ATP-dependent RNA helicase DbpA [Pseudoalteromonas luteoviolacea]